MIHFFPITKGVKDEKKRKAFRDKICSYIDRAEKLKQLVEEIKECKNTKKIEIIYIFFEILIHF